jgi:hypothetical protein
MKSTTVPIASAVDIPKSSARTTQSSRPRHSSSWTNNRWALTAQYTFVAFRKQGIPGRQIMRTTCMSRFAQKKELRRTGRLSNGACASATAGSWRFPSPRKNYHWNIALYRRNTPRAESFGGRRVFSHVPLGSGRGKTPPAPRSDRTSSASTLIPADCNRRRDFRRIITVMQYDAVMRVPSTSATDRPKASGTRITITLPPEHYEHVVWMAQKKRVSASWIVRDAVAKYLAEDMPLFAERGRDSQ